MAQWDMLDLYIGGIWHTRLVESQGGNNLGIDRGLLMLERLGDAYISIHVCMLK